MNTAFNDRLKSLEEDYETLLNRPNSKVRHSNGIFERYKYPILTAEHTPLTWRYDFNPETNPFLMERFGINATFNAGAIKHNDRYLLIVRVEGNDRKSFFAMAESRDGINGFKFWKKPLLIPENGEPDTNIYDMRLTRHEDGWIYGLFCTERRDPSASEGDQSAAIAQCGIIRTNDFKTWERLPDLVTPSPQQRNVVLHPEYVDGQYCLYTRPQDSFIDAGNGGGIGLGLLKDMTEPVIDREMVIDKKLYHTVYESKNGQGPTPIKTQKGWLHLAHGVRNTAAGLRYVLYVFLTDLKDLTKVIHKPGGYFLAPEDEERIGDVSNVVFSNGWIADEDGRILIYYASSDSRMHVAETSVDKLLNYVEHTREDGLTSAASAKQVIELAERNENYLSDMKFFKTVY